MATQEYTINQADGWVKVADAADDFLAENITAVPVEVRFDSAAPSPTDKGHVLKINNGITRVGSGDVYAKAEVDGAVLIVTV